MKKYEWVDTTKGIRILATEIMEEGAKIEISYWSKDYPNLRAKQLTILDETNNIISNYKKQ